MKKNKTSRAFSLIELSIVILIIGILIAGVTSGTSLIKKMRLSSAQSLTKSSGISSIKGLTLWLDATQAFSEKSLVNSSNSTSIEENDDIKSWIDTNPNDSVLESFSGTGAAWYPNYISDGMNGLPTIRFDGVNNRLTAATLFGELFSSDEGTIFIVLTTRNFADGIRTMGFYPGSTSSRINFYVGSTVSFAWYEASDGTNTNNNVAASTEGIPSIVSARRTSSTINVKVNGVVGTTTNNVTKKIAMSDTCDAFLGWNTNGTTLSPEMDVSEVIIFNRGLSDTDRLYVENYLAKKWRISIN